MINGIRLKVCGLTSLVDAEFADQCGADYLGFILFPASPRYVSLIQFQCMFDHLPARKKVAVSVEPAPSELVEMKAAGFDFFQIHFRPATPMGEIKEWSRIVGAEHLWLAPKLPPECDIQQNWLELADYCMLDTYAADKFGGTGETGDWAKFARHLATYPRTHWILAGGLDPDNIAQAVQASGAKFVDVASGVEFAPGLKDEAKIKQFAAELGKARIA
ncbi:MAG: phosphoribosylanthranilate isomerase [Cephaloticoccus sp.]|nr:phosphoribosylanthranilate isomerase [Cephaloticoccus sp.]MCF7761253.1 phosphoribosylanthranilate isomerase [Cephaloticoccus sp.]